MTGLMDRIIDYLADAQNPVDDQTVSKIAWNRGYTGVVVHLVKAGALAQCYLSFKHSTEWTSGTQYEIGYIPEKYRPVGLTVFGRATGVRNQDATITSAGRICVVPRENRAANLQEYISFPLYFCLPG